MQAPGPMVPYTLSARIRHGDLTEIAPASATAEVITMSAHTATHIDALCHVGEFQNADGELIRMARYASSRVKAKRCQLHH